MTAPMSAAEKTRKKPARYNTDHNPLRGAIGQAIKAIESAHVAKEMAAPKAGRCCSACTTRPYGSRCGNIACKCHR
ncbi:hypothetical protein LAROYE_3 [Arthrobacter phage Laroye]|uniref:Uncharacterized protein n=1 Tax=Arthrobacter phage Laroye TaxID=1772305 RepID=A0A0U4ILW3_9CAUD|nr:hypothetical protein FDH64_gp03 [Arthrobacter phage Laroye]ALY09530.1 hypothetical protein LAROYE_3 [Arthrobacter phage Laroye]